MNDMRRFIALILAVVLAAVVIAGSLRATAADDGARLFVFIYRPGPAWKPDVPMQQQGLGPHGAYMQKLLDSGHIFAAGGFPDKGGMAVVIAKDEEEARALLAGDPAVTSGIFVATLEPWRPRFRTSKPLP
jgi:uncharacterized protein YciI